MEPWEIEAREQIRDTVARYTHYGDSGRFDEFIGVFTEDGVLEMPGVSRREGRAAIKAGLTGRQQDVRASMRLAMSRHIVANVLIDFVSRDEADVSSYFVNLSSERVDHWGRYRDRMVRRGDRWLIQHRCVRLDARMDGSWAPELPQAAS